MYLTNLPLCWHGFSFSTTVARQSAQTCFSWLIPTKSWKKQTRRSRHLFGFLLFNSKHTMLVSCFCSLYIPIENKWEMENGASGPLHQGGIERGQFCFANTVIFLASQESSSAKVCFSHMDCVHVLYTNVCPLSVREWFRKAAGLKLLSVCLIWYWFYK